MKQTSNLQSIQDKIEAKRYSYFTLPILDITIKYRKPDLLKLSFNNSLPSMMADNIIGAYKANVEGNGEEYLDKLKDQKITADDKLVQELRDKGFNLLEELAADLKILNVPQSDFSNGVIAWDDIPEEDAIAFLMHLINAAQTVATASGGEISEKEITDFPDSKRVGKRSAAR